MTSLHGIWVPVLILGFLSQRTKRRVASAGAKRATRFARVAFREHEYGALKPEKVATSHGVPVQASEGILRGRRDKRSDRAATGRLENRGQGL